MLRSGREGGQLCFRDSIAFQREIIIWVPLRSPFAIAPVKRFMKSRRGEVVNFRQGKLLIPTMLGGMRSLGHTPSRECHLDFASKPYIYALDFTFLIDQTLERLSSNVSNVKQ